MRLIANTAEISTGASLQGFLVAGEDAKISAYAHIENTVVLPGATASDIHKDDVVL
ncbi:MAG: hypothetical protein HC902_12570 [Calothrix sp. SM1_5_4]|nr:hypothetical protein [Calothrix sp. SM1_5_4]